MGAIIVVTKRKSGTIVMPGHIVQNLANASVDTNGRAIQFSLTVSDGAQIPFVMGYAASTQVIGALGRTFLKLHETIEKSKGKLEALPLEHVARAHIQQDRLTGNVIFQMITPAGIPYSFVLTPKAASDIADMLKTESGRPYQPGSA
jgi:hypothetical protein